jgi:hypothetical protein
MPDDVGEEAFGPGSVADLCRVRGINRHEVLGTRKNEYIRFRIITIARDAFGRKSGHTGHA